jgi:spore coat protein CotH
MKVSELIEQLKTMPQDAIVYKGDPDCDFYYKMDRTEVRMELIEYYENNDTDGKFLRDEMGLVIGELP